MAYRIRDWNRLFENNRTRELKRLEWVPVPNKMDGSGYTELVDHPNGAAHLGAWLAILEIASRQSVRGTIPQESATSCGSIPQDTAATCRCLSRISRLPVQIFTEVIPRLLQIGWLECEEVQQNVRDREIPQDDAEKCLSRAREGNGMEGNGIEHTQARAPDGFAEFWQRWPRKSGEDAAAHAWISYVHPGEEPLVFACLDRFLQSGDVARGAIPYAGPHNGKPGWLADCARDRWQCTWPPASKPNGKESRTAMLNRVLGES